MSEVADGFMVVSDSDEGIETRRSDLCCTVNKKQELESEQSGILLTSLIQDDNTDIGTTSTPPAESKHSSICSSHSSTENISQRSPSVATNRNSNVSSNCSTDQSLNIYFIYHLIFC
jgi:hypothetical protein